MAKPASSPQPAGLRRRPRQARGRERVDRILDAAAAVFAEVGYDAATTNAIAQRADTSIGSLYQFFPHKQAILQALSERYLEALRPLLDRIFAPDMVEGSVAEAVGRMIDALDGFHAARPGFQHVFYGSHGSSELSEAARGLNAEVTQRLAALLSQRAPGLAESDRLLCATVSVETVKSLLALSVARQREPGFHAAVIAETKALLIAYLDPLVNGRRRPGNPGVRP